MQRSPKRDDPPQSPLGKGGRLVARIIGRVANFICNTLCDSDLNKIPHLSTVSSGGGARACSIEAFSLLIG